MMAIGVPYPFSTISKLGTLNLLVIGNGDQRPLLFFSTFSAFETLDFPTSDGDPPPFLPLSFLLELRAFLQLAMVNIFLFSHLSQSS
jgi:hypothetical protein